MRFGHEQLVVYWLAINYVAWSYAVAKELNGVDRHARDHLLRAAIAVRRRKRLQPNGLGRMVGILRSGARGTERCGSFTSLII